MSKKSKFTWREWSFTGAEENLFNFDKESLMYFRLLVSNALKG